MRGNIVLSTYNRATYIDQKQAIMQEKHVAKSIICTCSLSHILTLLCMWACAHVIACLS